MPETYFAPAVFRFLGELRAHNERDWFNANKQRYERDVRDPILRFIADIGPRLQKISPHLVADPRPSGGSLFRIYRDTRFSKDKSPYKTHLGAHFFHENSKASASVPGFYLHVQPSESFMAAGIWHPDPKALGQVRDAIARGSAEWKALKKTKLPIQGGTLQRPPRGYAPDHPDIEFLKHTDFTTSVRLTDKELGRADFPATFIKHCKTMAPLVKFVTRAMDLPW